MAEVTIFCIVITYNGSKWIEKCFGSLSKSAIPLKIIAIDNASTDDTVIMIKEKFPLVEVIQTGSNLGFGQANNIGLRIALTENADYVFLLNQDTWIKENTIGELLRVSKDNMGFGILSPFHLSADEHGIEPLFQEFLSVKYTPELVSNMFLQRIQPIYETGYVHAASWFVSRKCIETVGGFDPLYFHYGEDDDYLQRVKYFKFKIGLVPSSVIVHDSIYNSWQQTEWDPNRNMVIALQQLKKMSPHFRSNVLSFLKTGFDELTTLLLFRKYKKLRFRFNILFRTILRIRNIRTSYKESFNKKGIFKLMMVNVIIPFYNAELFLEQTLASVEAQTYRNWSVIFIDDGSTDSSSLIAQRFLQRNSGKGKILQSVEARSGPAVGRNQALLNADGSYVICLDSDDLLAPFCLEQRVSLMQRKPELDWAVFNQYQCAPGEKEPFHLFNLPAKTRDEAIAYFLKMETAWQTMAPIWKTSAIHHLGGFDETLYPSEDPDIHLRALLDANLKMEICTDLPADCYYFISNKSEDKILAFWNDSIRSKFRFIKRTVEYLPGVVSPSTFKIYKKYIREGYFNFIKLFLLTRFKEHNKQFREIKLLLLNAGILYSKDILLIKFILFIFSSDSLLLKHLRLRGAVHRLLLRRK